MRKDGYVYVNKTAFGNYRFATDTPSYLVYLLKKHNPSGRN
ncbi:hypothetical protein [Phocaeicola massiliensis]